MGVEVVQNSLSKIEYFYIPVSYRSYGYFVMAILFLAVKMLLKQPANGHSN